MNPSSRRTNQPTPSILGVGPTEGNRGLATVTLEESRSTSVKKRSNRAVHLREEMRKKKDRSHLVARSRDKTASRHVGEHEEHHNPPTQTTTITSLCDAFCAVGCDDVSTAATEGTSNPGSSRNPTPCSIATSPSTNVSSQQKSSCVPTSSILVGGVARAMESGNDRAFPAQPPLVNTHQVLPQSSHQAPFSINYLFAPISLFLENLGAEMPSITRTLPRSGPFIEAVARARRLQRQQQLEQTASSNGLNHHHQQQQHSLSHQLEAEVNRRSIHSHHHDDAAWGPDGADRLLLLLELPNKTLQSILYQLSVPMSARVCITSGVSQAIRSIEEECPSIGSRLKELRK